MKNQKSLENQNSSKSKTRPLAVVTGASSGIGYELAKVFAKNSFDLLVVAEDAGIADAGNAFRQLGCTVETLQTNLAHFKGVDSLRDKIKSMGRPIDSIAINAGVGVGGKFIETELADEINLIQLNIVSVVHLTKHVLKDMVDQGYGRILITSSVAAEMPDDRCCLLRSVPRLSRTRPESSVAAGTSDDGPAARCSSFQFSSYDRSFHKQTLVNGNIRLGHTHQF